MFRCKNKRQYMAAFSVCVGAVIAGILLGWTSPVCPQLSSIMTTPEISLMSSMLAIGAALAAVPAGIITQNIGRRCTIVILTIPFMISWFIIIFSNNKYLLIAARFIGGIGTGGVFVCVPMYIGEIAESSIRGCLMAFFQVSLTLGILFSYVMGGLMSWKKFSMSCVVFVPIMLILVWFMPETPQFLLYKKLQPRAMQSLKWLRDSEANLAAELDDMQKEIDEASLHKANISTMLSRRGPRKGFICALGLMIFQQFSGIDVFIFYTNDIFLAAGSTISSDLATIIIGVFLTLTACLSAVLVDRAGRKLLLLLSCFMLGVTLIILGVYFKLKADGYSVASFGWLPLLCLIWFIFFFSVGLGPIPWMLMVELIPVEFRGLAGGISVVNNWIWMFVVTLSFPIMKDVVGVHYCFWFLAFIMEVCVFFTFILVPETKGKTVTQIQAILSGNNA